MINKLYNDKTVWLDLVNPTMEDFDFIRENYDFHHLDIEDCMSKVQRSKLDEYDDYKFIVLHFPISKENSNRLILEEVDIFWGKGFVITLHSGRLGKLTEIFNHIKSDTEAFEKYFSKGTDYFLYKILHKLVVQAFPILRQMAYEIDWIDDNYDKISPSKVIDRISALRRNIIFLQTSLKPQKNIFFIFENRLKDQEEKEMDIYWGDIGDYIGKLMDMAEDYQELIEGLYSSIDTLVTYRTNNIMKILTMFNVIMLPLTFITSFYGMNVKLPLQNYGGASVLIGSSMFAITIGMIIYFRIKRF